MSHLTDKHRADLRSSGLTDETIALSGAYSASATQTKRLLGFPAGPGLCFPFRCDPPLGRVKPDKPFRNGDGNVAKYVSPKKETYPAGNRLYVPANLPEGALDDPERTLVITEGEKKALAGCQAGFATIALTGVTCWMSRNCNGTSSPIKDLDLVEWVGREVMIAFDSDAASKPEVRNEETKLAHELIARGATVKAVRFPKPTPRENQDHALGGKFGLDDFLKVRGLAAFQSVLERAKEVTDPAPNKKQTIADLADEFLREEGWIDAGDLKLLWWREEFYRYTGTHYERIPDGDLKALVNSWLRAGRSRRGRAGTRATTAILQNVQAVSLVAADQEPPCWLDTGRAGGDVFAFPNGLLSLDDALAGRLDALRPHSPDFFSLDVLPYALDPDADCPTFLRVLQEALPDPDLQELVRQMFGYLLAYDTSQEKFFLLEGAGANGKTVICTVLREVLGPDNVSSVDLGAFDASRTFPLAVTIGKKANIVEELDEVTRAAEGTLKNWVTGKPMTIERKHKDAFSVTPTARLVFATNVLPRFVDPTDGLWRRMVLIPFREQILDESKQDKRFIDPAFWRESGELPGVFLWALGGLASLRTQGKFVEPEACRTEKATYRADSNPAATFLDECCQARDGCEIASQSLYRHYRGWAEDRGYRPLANVRFAKEVKRALPSVTLTRNARYIEGTRSRVWMGLAFHEGADT